MVSKFIDIHFNSYLESYVNKTIFCVSRNSTCRLGKCHSFKRVEGEYGDTTG